MSSSPSSHSFRDWLQLHLIALAWGITGVLGKLMTLPPLEVVAWRTGVAALGLAVLAVGMRASLRIGGVQAWRFIGSGSLVGLHWLLFFLSARLGNVSMCMAALPTTMLWCSLLEPLVIKGKRLSKMELVMGAIMVGAVWMIYRVEFTHWLGFTAGLGAALAGAVFAVINKRLVTREHFAVISCYQMTGACLTAVVALPFFSKDGVWLHAATGGDVACLLVLSLVCTVGAYAAYMDVLRRVSVFTVNVMYNMEPVYGILLAALVFGDTERMSPGFYLGAGVILAAVLALPWINRRFAAGCDGVME